MTRHNFTCSLTLCLVTLIASGSMVGQTSEGTQTDRNRENLLGLVRQLVIRSGMTTVIKTYDRGGALLETVTRMSPSPDQSEAGEQTQTLRYFYESNGQLTREMIEEGDGQPYISKLYSYDKDGRRSAEASYHMCGTFSSLHVYSYDREGALREDLLYQYRSLILRLYERESRGPTSQLTDYKNGILRSASRFRYDRQGRVTERLDYLADGTLAATASFQYDEKGNAVAEEVRSPVASARNAESRSIYEYDSHGNWIKRVVRRSVIPIDEDGKPLFEPVEITERTITYYEIRIPG